MIDTTNMTPEEIENVKVEREKDLQKGMDSLHTVEMEDLELARQVAELTAKRKPLQMAIAEGKHNIRTIKIDIEILTTLFWKARR